MATALHLPVLLDEAMAYLQPRAGGTYVDGTVGGGGHAEVILEQSAPTGRLLGLDLDPEAIVRVAERLRRFGDRLELANESFATLEHAVRWHGFAPADGILFDLGLSSFQLDALDRGFAFRSSAPLDMRFNPAGPGETARDLINRLSVDELVEVFRRFGEEPHAVWIARAIVQDRQRQPIVDTAELAGLVERVVGSRRGKIHPATRIFQALRIAVNHELEALAAALPQAVELLAPGGRLVVISFHSLEDRIVKHYLSEEARTCICPPGLPVCVCGHQPSLQILTRHGIRPTAEEVARNPRSRSATLRAVQKLAAA